jgi:hypothetical protein
MDFWRTSSANVYGLRRRRRSLGSVTKSRLSRYQASTQSCYDEGSWGLSLLTALRGSSKLFAFSSSCGGRSPCGLSIYLRNYIFESQKNINLIRGQRSYREQNLQVVFKLLWRLNSFSGMQIWCSWFCGFGKTKMDKIWQAFCSGWHCPFLTLTIASTSLWPWFRYVQCEGLYEACCNTPSCGICRTPLFWFLVNGWSSLSLGWNQASNLSIDQWSFWITDWRSVGSKDMLQEFWNEGWNIGSDQNPLQRGHLCKIQFVRIRSFKF